MYLRLSGRLLNRFFQDEQIYRKHEALVIICCMLEGCADRSARCNRFSRQFDFVARFAAYEVHRATFTLATMMIQTANTESL